MLALRSTFRAVRSPVTSFASKQAFHLAAAMSVNPKIAVVLAGCGVYDGSECHEASAIMVHLSRAKADMSVFAPDVDQMHVIDHAKGAPMEGQTRNVLVESARLSRGGVTALSELKADKFDALMFPGGFGAAKNLCTFAVDNADCKVNPDVERVVKEFHAAKKPIGMVCISPVIAAKLLPGVSLTVGSNEEEGGRWPYAGTAGAIEKMGGKHVKKNVHETNIDQTNKVVTSPAFMCDTAVHEIHDGIGAMVRDVLNMVKK